MTQNNNSSVKERRVGSVEPPPWFPLSDEQLYPNNDDKPNYKQLQQFFAKGGKLSEPHTKKILEDAISLFKEEPNCLDMFGNFTIVGDIHGQYYDLNGMLNTDFKLSSETNEPERTWLFLGDYVDRGSFGVEVTILLYSLKINFPKQVYLLRGNHECRIVTKKFNFYEEATTKYSQEVYELFMKSFDALPLAATLSTNFGIFFAVHGGISPKLDTINDINSLDRFCEPERDGPICDLIWSDPIEEDTADGLTPDGLNDWWDVQYVKNPSRGVGQVFGYKALNYFLGDNGLTGIIRGHETAHHGYIENWMKKKSDDRKFPYVVTVFSAPNYCGCYGNQASILYLNADNYHYRQFSEEPEPYVLPRSLNGLTYSIPYVTTHITSFISVFFGMVIDNIPDEDQQMREKLQQKVRNVGKMAKLMRTITVRNEKIRILKGLYGTGDLPAEITDMPLDKLDAMIHEYNTAKKIDEANEYYPSDKPPTSSNTNSSSTSGTGGDSSHNKKFWVGKSVPRESFERKNTSPVVLSADIEETYKKIRDDKNPLKWMITIYEEDKKGATTTAKTTVTTPTKTNSNSPASPTGLSRAVSVTTKNIILHASGTDDIPPLSKTLLPNVRAFCFFRLTTTGDTQQPPKKSPQQQQQKLQQIQQQQTNPQTTKFVFLTWCPDSIGPKKRGDVAAHKGFVQKVIKEFSVEFHGTEIPEILSKIDKLKKSH